MRRSPLLCALTLVASPVALAAQFPPDSFTNLKVLPASIPSDELVQMMAGFTRALGVRCTYCHVGEESQPLSAYDFASDEKEPKRKARVMLEMLGTINGHLDHLEARADPVVRVECFTCHRGSLRPRTLQASLLLAHEAGGIDSLVNAYNGLRTRWYGRAAYDFGEVALADVGGEIGSTRAGWADAERVHALNVEMNPSSNFARRQHVQVALARAFSESDAAGRARAATLRSEYGDAALAEPVLNGVGYALLGAGEPASAVAMFRYVTEQHPESGNAFDSLGEGLVAAGDVAGAIAAYERSLALDPQNANARTKLAELRGRA